MRILLKHTKELFSQKDNDVHDKYCILMHFFAKVQKKFKMLNIFNSCKGMHQNIIAVYIYNLCRDLFDQLNVYLAPMRTQKLKYICFKKVKTFLTFPACF